jgi:hypothetical protein
MSELFFKGSRKEVTLPLVVNCISPQGKIHPVQIKGKYRVIEREEQESLRQQLTDKSLTQEAAIRLVILGWFDVQDENNQQIEYNEENLTQALNNPYYFEALSEGAGIVIYSKDVMARVKAKNS